MPTINKYFLYGSYHMYSFIRFLSLLISTSSVPYTRMDSFMGSEIHLYLTGAGGIMVYWYGGILWYPQGGCCS